MLRQDQLTWNFILLNPFQFIINQLFWHSLLYSWSYKGYCNIFPTEKQKMRYFFLYRCDWWEVKGSNKDKPVIVCLRKCDISSGGWKVQTHSLQGLQIDKAFTGKKICFSVFSTSSRQGLVFGENTMSALVVHRLSYILLDLFLCTVWG